MARLPSIEEIPAPRLFDPVFSAGHGVAPHSLLEVVELEVAESMHLQGIAEEKFVERQDGVGLCGGTEQFETPTEIIAAFGGVVQEWGDF